MKTLQLTTKTPDEIKAAFRAVFKGMKPANAPKPVTMADRMAPYRKAILKQRRRGLTWKQIADGMRDPRIGEKVSHRLLSRLFGEKNPVVNKAPDAHLTLAPSSGETATVRS